VEQARFPHLRTDYGSEQWKKHKKKGLMNDHQQD
jgi:hypothetical protein